MECLNWSSFRPTTTKLQSRISFSDGHMETGGEYGYRKFLAFRGYGGPNCGVDVVCRSFVPILYRFGIPFQQVSSLVRETATTTTLLVWGLPNSDQFGSLYSTQPNPNFDSSVENDPSMIDWILETANSRQHCRTVRNRWNTERGNHS